MRSIRSPLTAFLALFIFALASGVPIRSPLDHTTREVGGIYTNFTKSHGQPVLPREEHTSAPNFVIRFSEPGAAEEQPSTRKQRRESVRRTENAEKVAGRPRTVNVNGKREVLVEAKFDPRSEVAEGRGAKGVWRSAVNQFLPS
jgi:hypothetical protein